MTALQPGAPTLTQREWQILEGIVAGLCNKEIGRQLGLSYRTVQGYNRIMRKKLNAKTQAQMVARAFHTKLLICPTCRT